MKNFVVKFFSIVIAIFMILPAISIISSASRSYGYDVGDIIEFGSYPQTLVTDKILISILENNKLLFDSYDYYIGDGRCAKLQLGLAI